MTDKLDVEAHSGPCDRLGICELCTLRLELRAKDEAIAREHELYLTAHRDNMKAATMLMEIKKERDEFRDRDIVRCTAIANLHSSIRELQAQIAQKDEALRAALDTVDVGCRLDHEGYCQNHNLEQDCWVPKARAALRQSVPASHEAGEGRR